MDSAIGGVIFPVRPVGGVMLLQFERESNELEPPGAARQVLVESGEWRVESDEWRRETERHATE